MLVTKRLTHVEFEQRIANIGRMRQVSQVEKYEAIIPMSRHFTLPLYTISLRAYNQKKQQQP